MFSKKIDWKLIGTIGGFVFLGILYRNIFSPIFFRNGEKFYNTSFTQGDVYTYIDFASREIQNHSFYEWFLKLNFNNISLVYFSWFQSVLGRVIPNEIVLTSFVGAVIFYIIFNIVKLLRKEVRYSALSFIMSFSLLLFIQTYSKEIWILLFLIIGILGVAKKDKRLIVLSLFFLMILRVYFAAIFVGALSLYFLINRASKKVVLSLIVCCLFLFPVIYATVFPHFLTVSNFSSTLGVSNYYLSSLSFPGLYLVWLPFKFGQNILEPFLKIYNTGIQNLIFQVPSFLDMLTSSAMVIMLVIIWRSRKNYRISSEFSVFLLIFVGVYIVVISSLPIVHFRYSVPLLPCLGILADLLNSNSTNPKS